MTLPPKLNRAFKSQSKIICLKDSATKEKEKVNLVYKKHMGNLKHETDFLELKKTFKFKYSLGKWKIITIKNEFNILEVERGKNLNTKQNCRRRIHEERSKRFDKYI